MQYTDYGSTKEAIALAITIHELKEIKYNLEENKHKYTSKQLAILHKLIANNAMVLTE